MNNIKKAVTFLLILQIFLIFTPYKEIEGSVRMVGTVIFPQLTILTKNNEEYYFDNSLFDDFKQYSGRNITIKAKIKNKKRTLADNSKTFIIPTIYKADIIKD
jgi:hypothetical protein